MTFGLGWTDSGVFGVDFMHADNGSILEYGKLYVYLPPCRGYRRITQSSRSCKSIIPVGVD